MMPDGWGIVRDYVPVLRHHPGYCAFLYVVLPGIFVPFHLFIIGLA